MNVFRRRLLYLLPFGCRSESSITGFQLVFNKFGNPTEVLKLEELKTPITLDKDEVLLKMLAAPVHPADINTIQGTYGIKPSFPAVPGIEGVAEVLQVGCNVKAINPKDRVIPLKRNFGTWRTHHICKASSLEKVPQDVSTLCAANIMGNPSTAYRMLTDFASPGSGETVIQNLANSAVGLAVVQIAHHFGLKTVNVIRNRPNIEDVKKYIQSVGGDYVVTEEELRTTMMSDIFKEVPLARLAFNGTGGRCATDMLRYIAEGGVMVTYGAMSRQPVSVSATALIFKNITLRGFWFNRWILETEVPQISQTLQKLLKMAQQGLLQPPQCSLVPLQNYHEALSRAMEPFSGKKQILVLSNSWE